MTDPIRSNSSPSVSSYTSDPIYAGFWLRFAANLIDSCLIFLAIVVLARDSKSILLLFSLAPLFYYAIMECSAAQATVGKLAVGIKVTDLLGQRVSFARAFGRNLGKVLSDFTLTFGYTMAGFTQRRQALHDKLAGTLVIRKRADAARVRAGEPAPAGSGGVIAAVILICLGIPGIGIIAGIVIPAYQEYTIRAQVSDGLLLTNQLETAVVKSYQSNKVWPTSITELSLSQPLSGPYIAALAVDHGAISVTYGNQANPLIANQVLSFRPSLDKSGAVLWTCGYATPGSSEDPNSLAGPNITDIKAKFLPAACR
jgi:uncharacterized RDD family membrane protein YckC/Tfp pilus assembly major pilin PilA